MVVRRAGMLVVGLMLLLCGTAHAGTFEVWSCAGPDGKPAVAERWETWFTGTQFATQFVNGCASGGGLYAGLDGKLAPQSGTRVEWSFSSPPDTTIASFRFWRVVTTTAVAGMAAIEFIGTEANGVATPTDVETCDSRAGCTALGSPAAPFGDASAFSSGALPRGIDKIYMDVFCYQQGAEYCPATGGPAHIAFRIHRAAIVLRDDSSPAFLSPPAGSLTAGGALTGTQTISFSAADKGGGVRAGALEIDGTTVGTRQLCATPYTRVVPCDLAAGGTLSVDTRTLADGPHTARVLVTDAGGNVTASEPIAFTTANTPTACAPEPAPAFSVAFDRGKGTIALGGKLRVKGTLGGVPAGTMLLLNSQVDRPGAPAKFGRTPVTVDAAGRFSYRVPTGPSRTLRFAQLVPGASAYACSAPLKVNVKATSSLKASPRTIRAGARVRFSGRLEGGYVPPGGKVIELQAHERGRWRSITTLRTNAKGAFSYRYRFSFRAAGTTFPVRVRIRHEGTYPFALGYSKRVKVRVR
jgi:hypothetical protein